MSGPKSTEYSLERQRRRLLEQHVACDRECATDRRLIEGLLSTMGAQLQELARCTDRLIAHAERIGKETLSVERLRTERMGREAMQTLLRGRLNGLTTAGTAQSELTEEVLLRKREERAALGQLLRDVRSSSEWIESALPEAHRLCGESSRALQETLQRELDGTILEFLPEESGADRGLEDRKNELREELVRIEGETLPEAVRLRARQAIAELDRITGEERLSSFRTVTYAALLRARKEAAALAGRHAELSAGCAVLCAQLGLPTERYPVSEEGVERLTARVEVLERQLIRERERAEIARTVDETMREMGYEVLGEREVSKRNGTRFRSELFRYSEGTAVNITYTSDGRITMELGIPDHGDRLPDAAEAGRLTEDMDGFCREFREFERRLAAKGVLVGRRLSMLPPSDAYAQVINVDDYVLSGDVRLEGTIGTEVTGASPYERRLEEDG